MSAAFSAIELAVSALTTVSRENGGLDPRLELALAALRQSLWMTWMRGKTASESMVGWRATTAEGVELPVDVLIEVFTELTPKTLNAASAVCRRWSDPARAALLPFIDLHNAERTGLFALAALIRKHRLGDDYAALPPTRILVISRPGLPTRSVRGLVYLLFANVVRLEINLSAPSVDTIIDMSLLGPLLIAWAHLSYFAPKHAYLTDTGPAVGGNVGRRRARHRRLQSGPHSLIDVRDRRISQTRPPYRRRRAQQVGWNPYGSPAELLLSHRACRADLKGLSVVDMRTPLQASLLTRALPSLTLLNLVTCLSSPPPTARASSASCSTTSRLLGCGYMRTPNLLSRETSCPLSPSAGRGSPTSTSRAMIGTLTSCWRHSRNTHRTSPPSAFSPLVASG
ncbi:hypothetical protein BDK51DRAFT_46472 [Blyttiomyces helicus]|uniref:F-box domain-containing protein n=1 Tax=Blyttiomyces helicus TaxID=388810 RepID=A0A4P9WBQ0_9FUNG|nr:hypothetical protein BDK51DRAFT_46472 [Blyttiomyces helicus]|eukprot:RKO90061.1 hypothetical protein BDK51DRAFT_46472 [Blyttiomyces helicus]